MELKILHLYYDLLNLYGEYGNISILANRLKDQEIKVIVDKKTVGDSYNLNDYDFIYCGSGTERNLFVALEDLKKHREELIDYIFSNKYGLFTGTSVEMLGKRLYKVDDGLENDLAETLDIFNYKCERLNERKTGDIIYSSKIFTNKVVGFINNQCNLHSEEEPLFTVGFGISNNPNEKAEGSCKNNFFATYVIGPLFVRNPEVLNYFVNGIIKQKDSSFNLKTIKYENEEAGYELVLKELSSQIK